MAYIASDPLFNNHGALQGDGIDDELQIADHIELEMAAGSTWFVVAAFSEPGVAKDFIKKNSGTQRSWILRRTATDDFEVFVRDSANAAWQTATHAGVYSAGSPHVFTARYNGSVVAAAVDGMETTAAATTSLDKAAVVKIGTGTTAKFAKVLAYNRDLLPTEVYKITRYLTTRYGI
jgi:hypothetical protein